MYLSDAGLNLLQGLLEYDSTKRLTAEQALQHPWFAEEPLPCPEDKMPVFAPLNEVSREQIR